jgi:serine/threonine protein kinase
MPGIEGSTLGRYELRHRIPRGGMAEVYLGYDRRVRRRVAVKVLYGSDEPFVRRFEREAEAVGTLSHDHILPLYDFGEQRPWYYLVMPYVEGGTLRDYLLKRERLDLEEASSFLAQIAAALQFAHDHGVVHRDVKPSNILLRPDGHAYLGDFGLAKATMGAKAVTHSGSMVGTPEYMAPEQSNGVHDYRSDIYSLGIILYQMLTGRVPFTADSPVAVSLKHIQANPRPPGELNSAISPAIEAVILKALAKDPDERYQQAEALAEAYQKHAVAWCYSGQQTFSNTIITAQAMLMHGDLYGLIFRLSPVSKSFYVLELNSQGDYRFVLAQGSNPLNWLTLIDWTHSSAIASGYGQTNTFLVMATRNHFRFYINKQLIVSSFSDSTYASGMIGFLAGGDSNGGTEASFSNIWVFQK